MTIQAVDLFAGAGGFSTGAKDAGVEVIWAANHWQAAVDCHAQNHAHTEHVCQDLNLYPACEIPDHDLLLASPSCKGFSPARGKHQAHHDKHRATAWIVIDVLEAKRPEFAVVENVPEMRDWVLFPSWLDAVRRLGYSASEYIIDAADHGVPQSRVRLFVVLSRSKAPFILDLPSMPHVPIEGYLRWEEGGWSDIETPRRAQRTLKRIRQALLDGFGPRFLLPYYGSTRSGRSTLRPIGTLTTKPRYALVDAGRMKMRMLSVEEARCAMGFPESYQLPKNIATANMLLGNAVCPPVSRSIVERIAGIPC